jgi:hypothetical protein
MVTGLGILGGDIGEVVQAMRAVHCGTMRWRHGHSLYWKEVSWGLKNLI